MTCPLCPTTCIVRPDASHRALILHALTRLYDEGQFIEGRTQQRTTGPALDLLILRSYIERTHARGAGADEIVWRERAAKVAGRLAREMKRA